MQEEVYSAIDEYAKSYSNLWTIVKNNPEEFPSGSISCGTVAEFYVKKYLEYKYPDSLVIFGCANEKAWDLKVQKKCGESRTFQVKSHSLFSNGRTLSKLTKGFDALIVISLDCDFFPYQAYIIDEPDSLFKNSSMPQLCVPNPDNPRQRGSSAFKNAKNIHSEFFDILSNVL
jgi:hypothetical protein